MPEPYEKVELETRIKELRRGISDKRTRGKASATKVDEASRAIMACELVEEKCRKRIAEMKELDLTSLDEYKQVVELRESNEDMIERHKISIRNGRKVEVDSASAVPRMEAELALAEKELSEWGRVIQFPTRK